MLRIHISNFVFSCFVCQSSLISIEYVVYAEEKPRIIVISDIGGDPDDQQSMIRLMLYSNEFDIEGLIASSRGLNGHDTKPNLIRQIIQAYGQVRNNLVANQDGYPTALSLMQKVKTGNPMPGLQSVRNGVDTEASEHIIKVIDSSDTRPVWFTIWGGFTDLAHALWKIRNTRSESEIQAFINKIRIYAIGDQDGTGRYIQDTFPNIFFIHAYTTSAPSYLGVPRGMYQNTSGGKRLVKDINLVSSNWIKNYVSTGHGPLGALYPQNALQTPASTYGVKEGDTPSFLYLLSSNLGLSDINEPSWGRLGWKI